PTFLPGGDVAVLEDSGGYSAPWASAIAVGPANEASQTPTFAVTGNTNAGLFSAGPVMAANGTLSFTPALDANGSADVTVELSDDGGTANGGLDTSAPATFTITLTPVNDPPLTVADPNPGVLEGGSVNVDVLANDSDVDLDPLLVGAITGVTNGSVVVEGDETITFTHDGSETVTAAFTYRANDGTVDGNPITITVDVTPVNDAPVAVGDPVVPGDPLFKTVEDETTPVLITAAVLKSNDTDAEGDPLTVETASGATAEGGAYSCSAVGCEYLPPAAFTGSDTFFYTVTDGALASGPATVNMDVRARSADIELTRIAGPAPDPVDAAAPVAIVYRVDNNGIDHTGGVDFISNLPVSFEFTSAASTKGLCTYDGLLHQATCDIGSMFPATSENVTLTLTPHTNGPVDVTAWVTASAGDPDILNNQVTATVNVVNNPPTGVADTVSVPEDSVAFLIAVLGNDTDPEGNIDPAATSVVGGVSNGTLVDNGDGTFDYTPTPDYAGADGFTYQVCDTAALCDSPVAVSITVSNLNDDPVLAQTNALAAVTGAATSITSGDLQVTDIDNTPAQLTFTLEAVPANGDIELSGAPLALFGTFTQADIDAGNVDYRHNGTATAVDGFSFSVSDGSGGSIPPTAFSITVTTPTLLVSEWRTSGPFAAGDDFIELYNPTAAPVLLDGWTITLHNSSGTPSTPEPLSGVPGTTIPAYSHYLLAPGSYVSSGPGTTADYTLAVQLQNSGGVTIYNPSAAIVDAVGSANGSTLPQMESGHDQSFERYAGYGYGNCVDTDLDTADFFHNLAASNPQNSTTAAEPCGTAPPPPAQPSAAHLVIGEFRTRGPAGPNDEFVEIFNPTSLAVSLTTYRLYDSSLTLLYDFSAEAPLLPGQHLLLAGPTFSGGPSDGALLVSLSTGDAALLYDGALPIDVVGTSLSSPYETQPLPGMITSSAVDESYERIGGQCVDSDNNLLDFWHNLGTSNPETRAVITLCP
ncbi:MAG: Ig-like domain-containing protein, partial [Acidimicrobiia bacterium]|nr:Ig-like domain-containing protein [Acidimicrobiia bacterium]